jgi:hypothetical protein
LGVGLAGYCSIMLSDREEAVEAFDALDAALARCAGLRVDGLTTPEWFALLSRTEAVRRRLPSLEHGLINRLVEQAVPAEIGGRLALALADRLRVSPPEARRRIHEAADLGERTAFTGEPLEPVLAATAAGQRAGVVGVEQVRVIRGFLHQLPVAVDVGTREAAEAQLAELAQVLRPDELRVAAERITALVNPDGTFCDADRARRRGVTVGRQGSDGMSPISGLVDPECRGYLDAFFAAYAAPGICNPDDQTPTVDGRPTDEQVARDTRSPAQRCHDALKLLGRDAMGGRARHRGLPVTVIVSTTLQELQAGAGTAVTGGGSWLPMSDVIRMASHAHHYLVIFDQHTNRALYLARDKRFASADQRIVLHATDRGCSHPGCTVPGYLCEVHHVDEWSHGGATNVDNLTFACTAHHRLLDAGWRTRKQRDGTTEWIPPPQLDHGRPRTNGYHHPHRYLTNDETE